MSSRKINIGVLGCANIAKKLVIPNILENENFKLIAVSSRTKEKAIEYSNLFNCDAVIGYDNLLLRDDIDAIYIPLPTGLHHEWIKKSIYAGKHIFSEKSITCTFEETLEVIELAKSNDICIFENFMFPFHSQYRFVDDLIMNGEIGNIKLLRSSFGFPIFDKDVNIRYRKELGGGALLDAGAYTLMASQLILGRKQTVISSSLENEDWEVDFQGSISLKNDENVVSQLSFGFDNYYQNNIEIWGSKGKIIMTRAFTAGPNFSPTVILENQNKVKENKLLTDNHFTKILNKFADCIFIQDYGFQFDQILSQSKLLTSAKDLNL